MKLELVLPVPTSINALYINQFRWDARSRSRVPTGGRILSKEGEKSKEQIQFHAEKQLAEQKWDYAWTEDKNNFLYLDVDVYFDRRGRDSDNIFKLLNDSLEKLVFDNDSRVLARVQKVLFDKANPRIEVSFSPVNYVGVFENQKEADMFESKCQGCTRFLKGRCSILVDSLASTVREEVDLSNTPKCKEYKEKKS